MKLRPISVVASIAVVTLVVAGASAASRMQETNRLRTAIFKKADTPLPPDVFCKIDGFPVSRADFGDWLQRYRGDLYATHFVTGRLVRNAASTVGAEVKPEEINQVLDRRIEERILTTYRGKRDVFIEQECTNFGKTLEQHRASMSWDVETELLVQRVLKRKRLTTDADVEAEFRRLYGASGRELWLRAILCEVQPASIGTHKSPEEIRAIQADLEDKAKRKAIDVMKRLQSGAIDFPSAAQAYSDDFSSRSRGGDIGNYQHTPPEFGDAFDAAIQKAKVGQILGPVRAQAGYIVAEVTKEKVHDLRAEREALRKVLAERDATFEETSAFVTSLLTAARLER